MLNAYEVRKIAEILADKLTEGKDLNDLVNDVKEQAEKVETAHEYANSALEDYKSSCDELQDAIDMIDEPTDYSYCNDIEEVIENEYDAEECLGCEDIQGLMDEVRENAEAVNIAKGDYIDANTTLDEVKESLVSAIELIIRDDEVGLYEPNIEDIGETDLNELDLLALEEGDEE